MASLAKAFPHLRYGSAVSPSIPDAADGPKVRKRRKMSAKARKAISDAQKARWAKQKAGKK